MNVSTTVAGGSFCDIICPARVISSSLRRVAASGALIYSDEYYNNKYEDNVRSDVYTHWVNVHGVVERCSCLRHDRLYSDPPGTVCGTDARIQQPQQIMLQYEEVTVAIGRSDRHPLRLHQC
nr:hypothetical protein CFP56_79107 [Quercus suber]